MGRSKKRLTILELSVALGLVCVAALIAVPWYFRHIRQVERETCIAQRQSVLEHYADYRARFRAQSDLLYYVEADYGNVDALCPSGGHYEAGADASGRPTLRCTVHGEVPQADDVKENGKTVQTPNP